ncbi:MAG: catalase, partial [Yaniella sp.]|nr:catalase [Yaniella sp.]
FSQEERDGLVETVSGALETVIEPVLSNAIQYWKNVDETIGQRIEENVRQGAVTGDQQPGGDPLDNQR